MKQRTAFDMRADALAILTLAAAVAFAAGCRSQLLHDTPLGMPARAEERPTDRHNFDLLFCYHDRPHTA